MLIWLTNLLIFALWYWEMDRGGPGQARRRHTTAPPDFLFPQMSDDRIEPRDWRPKFIDYLYVSLTNNTAFSPTDTMPLTPMAKIDHGRPVDRLAADDRADRLARRQHPLARSAPTLGGSNRTRRPAAARSRSAAAASLGSSASACTISSRTSSPAAERRVRASSALERALAVASAAAAGGRAAPTRRRRTGPALGRALGGLLGEVDRADVLVDARGEAVRAPGGRRRRAPSRAPRAPAASSLPACQKASVISRSTATLRGLGVARVDQPLGGELVLALGHRALRGDHEALDALLGGVGL